MATLALKWGRVNNLTDGRAGEIMDPLDTTRFLKTLARRLMVPTAVLLDFDGVIADLENLHVAAWQRCLTRLGWEIPDEVAAGSVVIGDHQFISEIFTNRGIDEADVDGWVAKKRELTRTMIHHSPRLHAGAAELVRNLAGRARLAVVSIASRETIETLLGETGLLDSIDVIVAGEDARETPPRPDSRLLALKLLDVAPDQAVSIEGTPQGLLAALAARTRVIAVEHVPHPIGDWVVDNPSVPSLEPTSDILAQLGFGNRETS